MFSYFSQGSSWNYINVRKRCYEGCGRRRINFFIAKPFHVLFCHSISLLFISRFGCSMKGADGGRVGHVRHSPLCPICLDIYYFALENNIIHNTWIWHYIEWQLLLDVESTLARWRSLSDRLHYDRYNMIVITIAVSSQLMNVNGPVRWHYHEWHSTVSKRRIFFHHWWTGWQCENVGWPRAIHRKWCCGKAWKPNVMNEVSVNKQNGTL